VGCGFENAAHAEAIKKVIHEDSLTGTDPTPGHAAAMRRIDLSACPDEFREAYVRHIQAWDTRAQVEAARIALENGTGAAMVGGALATLFDSAATPFADHARRLEMNKQDAAAARAAITSTWNEVEAVASRYGVQFQQ
jgi:hypothetical protein